MHWRAYRRHIIGKRAPSGSIESFVLVYGSVLIVFRGDTILMTLPLYLYVFGLFCQMFVFIFMSVIMGIIFLQLDLSRNGLQSRSVDRIVITRSSATA